MQCPSMQLTASMRDVRVDGIKIEVKDTSVMKKRIQTQNFQIITHWQNPIWRHRAKICFSFFCSIYCWEKSAGCTAQHILWAVSCNPIFYSSDFHTGISYRLYYFCNNHRGKSLPCLYWEKWQYLTRTAHYQTNYSGSTASSNQFR